MAGSRCANWPNASALWRGSPSYITDSPRALELPKVRVLLGAMGILLRCDVGHLVDLAPDLEIYSPPIFIADRVWAPEAEI
jgi:hypothetical protein